MNFSLISTAWAADTATATAAAVAPVAEQTSGWDEVIRLSPLIGLLVILYVMLIRPQQKRYNEHQKMVRDIRRGDKIITGGGVFGTVIKLEGEDVLVVEIADNIRIRVQRGSISTVVSRSDSPANANEPSKSQSA